MFNLSFSVMEASYKEATQFFLLLMKFVVTLFFRTVYEMANDFIGFGSYDFIDE